MTTDNKKISKFELLDYCGINCPSGHLTTRYLYSFKDEVNYEDIPIFYCWSCKQEFSFR